MAWAVRDIIAKAGRLEKNDQHYSEKLDYEHLLGMKVKKDKEVQEPLLQEHNKETVKLGQV